MKILVSGANGQVGWEIDQQGSHTKHDVVALGRDRLDIQDADSVQRCFNDMQPDIMINAAAYTAVDRAEEESELAFAINRDGAAHLARACQQAAIPLLHISTDYVFDGTRQGPYLETDVATPLGVYGQSKWAGENAVRETLNQHIILRTSWVFGIHGHNFVKTILRVGAERDELKVVSDQMGGPTSAAGIAAALLTLCDNYSVENTLRWGTYHFSGQPFTSWHGFAKEIVRLGQDAGLIKHEVKVHPIPTSEYPTPASRPANSCLSTDKMTATLGIEADQWQTALQHMVKVIAEQS